MHHMAWVSFIFTVGVLAAADPPIPPVLEPWKDWVLADQAGVHSPARFDKAGVRMSAWPSVLNLEATAETGTFAMEVMVFDETWVLLPGGPDHWPQQVQVDGQAVAVVRRGEAPGMRLGPGWHQVSGQYRWEALPEFLAIPQMIGVLRLSLNGQSVEAPNWDGQGLLWLQRNPSEEADQDQLGMKVYRLLSDGIPMWLATAVELTVAGKSREVELGHALPDGWRAAKVESPVPCLVDDAGLMKVQVRPGTWTVTLTAFRTQPQETVGYAAGTRPLVAAELIALQPDTTLRVVEIGGLEPVDASQTTFPESWRRWPVFAWSTAQPFRLEEKLRGMGMEKPAPPTIRRDLWLDEDGRAVTFRDAIEGGAQRLWRLDTTEGQELGAVKSRGMSQLITRNPRTGRTGVEVRDRELLLEAVGRAPLGNRVSATGWETVAAPVSCEWHLPPGWRMIALFGAEWVDGDWLTAWSLLDVFLLLVFSLAVHRMWGWRAGVVAFGAFVLAYHEPGAPRWSWLFLVVVLAIGRALAGVRPSLSPRWRLVIGAAMLMLLWGLVPFVTRQVTALLYPQLESTDDTTQSLGFAVGASRAAVLAGATMERYASEDEAAAPAQQSILKKNLAYDQSVQIQTGPAVPKWEWRSVRYGWNGPVAVGQTVKPVLLTCGGQRVLIAVRLALLGGLLWCLVRRRSDSLPTGGVVPPELPKRPPTAVVALLLSAVLAAGMSQGLAQQSVVEAEVAGDVAQQTAMEVGGQRSAVGDRTSAVGSSSDVVLPSADWLNALRDRLLKPDDAFPHAAEIAAAVLKLDGRRLEVSLEVHAAVETAVPLPGRLPTWSPVTVTVDDSPASAVQRLDGYVWAVVPAGVHRVRVTGVLPAGREWEWSFLLLPRRVEIVAPGWSVSGVKANGVPENQVFLTEQEPGETSTAGYDRRDFQPLVAIERHLELGLVWNVRTVARRLTDKGAAISLSIPLLPGERLLTSNLTTANDRVEVRLGAQEETIEWPSELTPRETLPLQAEVTDRWVERWHLEASPVWNVEMEGPAPIYEGMPGTLVPVWRPWPGESVSFTITQPEAIRGQTMTVRRVAYHTQLGGYQRSVTLTLDIDASLGHDLGIDLPADAEVTALTSAGQRVPVRLTDGRIIVPVRPGEQTIALQWTAATPLSLRAQVDPLRLPGESANLTYSVAMPAQRWVLWADGPMRGPAVRFWSLLVCALAFAWVLGSLPLKTFKRWEWALLLVGLTQTSLVAAFFVVLWIFALAARGRFGGSWRSWLGFNGAQLALVGGTLISAGVLISVLHVGLLGDPRMFIRGEGSTTDLLRWFQPRSGPDIPTPWVISVSIWIYRLLMLAWALWLAFALLRWVKWGWQQFTAHGIWQARRPKAPKPTPPSMVPPPPSGPPAPPLPSSPR
ncbi:MAG: hypothetical protein ACKV19_26045 [Verrucomicrobiales bacterium]